MPDWNLLGALLLPNIGGWAGLLAVTGQFKWYENIKKPSLNPPNRVLGPLWTVLYTAMGYASYLVYKECGGFTEKSVLPFALYGGQLLLNWTWTPIFLGYQKMGMSFVHILALDVGVAACTGSFFEVNRTTAYFMVPYMCWLTFDSTMCYYIWQLNKKSKNQK